MSEICCGGEQDARYFGFTIDSHLFTADSSHLIYRPFGTFELWSYSMAEDLHVRLDELFGSGSGIENLWSVKGDDVLVEHRSAASRLTEISADGSEITALFDQIPGDQVVTDIHFDPDQKNVVIEIFDSGSGANGLTTLELESGTSAELQGGTNHRFVAFTPEGQWVLYQDDRDPEDPYQISLWIEHVDGGPPIQLTPDGFGPIVEIHFPTDRRVLFTAERNSVKTLLYGLELDFLPIFEDGFETGNTSRWSSTQ